MPIDDGRERRKENSIDGLTNGSIVMIILKFVMSCKI